MSRQQSLCGQTYWDLMRNESEPYNFPNHEHQLQIVPTIPKIVQDYSEFEIGPVNYLFEAKKPARRYIFPIITETMIMYEIMSFEENSKIASA